MQKADTLVVQVNEAVSEMLGSWLTPAPAKTIMISAAFVVVRIALQFPVPHSPEVEPSVVADVCGAAWANVPNMLISSMMKRITKRFNVGVCAVQR